MGPTMYSLLCLAVLVGIPATGWAQTIAPSLTELSGRVKPGDTVYVTESSQPVKGKLCRMAEKAKPSNWATAGVLHSLLEGLGAVGSVAMLIWNRRRPGVSLRRTGLVSFFGLMLLVPSQGSAQALQSFEDLALRVNLDDRLQVEDQSGVKATGRLTRLTRDEITIQTDAGEKHFTRETVRQVAVRHQPLRMATLIGAGAGAAYGAWAECRGGEHAECPDGLILLGGLGAGAGLAVGALIHRTTIVYPEPEKRTFILPAISRDAVGVLVSRRW